MKKLCMLLCCITLLAGCVSREQAISDKADGKPPKQSASNEALQLKRCAQCAGKQRKTE